LKTKDSAPNKSK